MTSDFNIVSTREISSKKIKLLGYGYPKVGKTSLTKTLPRTEDSKVLYIPVDPGYLALRDNDFHVVSMPDNQWTIKKFEKLYEWVRLQAADGKYQWCVIDGLDDIGTIVLEELKKKNTNLMKAYGEMADWCTAWIKAMRDIDGVSSLHLTHIVEKEEGDGGKSTFYPSIPGRKLLYEMDRLYDIIFCMRFMETETGPQRILQCSPEPDTRFTCGDRSGSLLPIEPPDITQMCEKIEKNIPGSTRPEIEQTQKILIQLKNLHENSAEAKDIINKYLRSAGVSNPKPLSLPQLEELLMLAKKERN